MLNESKMGGVALGAAAEVKRWSAGRKKEVVLRLLRGEPVDAISREVSVPIYKLERWRDRYKRRSESRPLGGGEK